MKIIQTLFLGTMLITGSCYADSFGFQLGPFDLQFGEETSGRLDRNPICEAISTQQQLGIVVQGREIINTK